MMYLGPSMTIARRCARSWVNLAGWVVACAPGRAHRPLKNRAAAGGPIYLKWRTRSDHRRCLCHAGARAAFSCEGCHTSYPLLWFVSLSLCYRGRCLLRKRTRTHTCTHAHSHAHVHARALLSTVKTRYCFCGLIGASWTVWSVKGCSNASDPRRTLGIFADRAPMIQNIFRCCLARVAARFGLPLQHPHTVVCIQFFWRGLPLDTRAC